MPTNRHSLTDAGDVLIALAGPSHAPAVRAEIDRVRRVEGILCAVDVAAYRKYQDGPLNALRVLLDDEALTVAVWAESGFGMLQRRSGRKQTEQACLNQGLDAAVDWATTNGNSERLNLDILNSMLQNNLDGSFGEAMVTIVERSIRKWKRVH